MASYHTRRRPALAAFLGAVAEGAGVGALIGLVYIWQVDYSLPTFLAGLIGGSVTGAVVGAYMQFVGRPSEIATAVVCTSAGALGGAAWWLIAGAAMSLWAAAAIGAGIVMMLLIAAKLNLPI